MQQRATGTPHHGGRPRDQGRGHPRDDQRPTIDVSRISLGEPLDPKLFSDIAEEMAKQVSPGRRAQANKPTQLRRFFDELVMLQDKVGSDAERFNQQLPFIQMLKAKVAYAKGRDKVDGNFEALLRRVVDEIRDADRLKRARVFMEAFMAFYKVYGPKD
jgi:CRISPR-associated protein Csm2